jgi:hypothetical protein
MKRAITAGVVVLHLLLVVTDARPQTVPLEYQVKAVYLFNFVKYVTWPPPARKRPITICIAERNPFGEALKETLRQEVVHQRPLEARLIAKPEPGCDVVFVPRDSTAKPYLEAARRSATLTVGEQADFLQQGGIINFIIEEGSVRFEIDPEAAERAHLRISSHLLRLGRGDRGDNQW